MDKARDRKNKFELDDKTDVDLMVDGLENILGKFVECAKVHLPFLKDGGPELKKERNNTIRKYHEVCKKIVEAKLQVQLMPSAVQCVYNDLDLEQVLEEEDDDDQFVALLHEFEESAMKEAEKRCAEVDGEDIDNDEGYQECLEALNQFVDRGSKAGGSGQAAAAEAPPPVNAKGKKQGTAASQGYSEGLEALTEYIPTQDPITKKAFTDPYINRVCGHVYEYESINELIQGGKIRCPYPSCTNKNVIKSSDLVKDEQMARKIAERISGTDLNV